MKTFTITKTVTNTQLGIATAVLLGVSALAFMIIPALNTQNSVPSSRSASWVCQDGYTNTQGGGIACEPNSVWFLAAQQDCSGHCNYANICGLKAFSLSTPCSVSACLGLNEKVYGTLKCCAGLGNINGYCRAQSTCLGIDQQLYGASRCCAGLVGLNGFCRNPNCIDLDGKNYFKLSNITTSTGKVVATDKCATKNFLGRYTLATKGKFVAERICSKAGMDTIYYSCPKGCVNGACVK